MEKRNIICEGKTEILYAVDDPSLSLIFFKDEALLSGQKGCDISRGAFDNAFSCRLFNVLEKEGIKTHFVKKISNREMLVRRLETLSFEVVVWNVCAASLSERMRVEEGRILSRPVIEFLNEHGALMSEDHILALYLCADQELINIRDAALRANEVLKSHFNVMGIRLIDFKIKFGRFKREIVVGGSLSPDACRLWETGQNMEMAPDRLLANLGDFKEIQAQKKSRGEENLISP